MNDILDKNSLNIYNKYASHQLKEIKRTSGIYETVNIHYECTVCKIQIVLMDTITYGCALTIGCHNNIGNYHTLRHMIDSKFLLTCKEYQIKNIIE